MKDIIIKLLTGASQVDYAMLASQLTLTDAIAKIDWLFGCEAVLKEFNSDFTIPYYTQSEWGYQIYHSGQDAIHMALNVDGVFNPDGYYAQPRVVAEQICELDARNVLELGSGKGFNSCFLAQQYPEVNFTGIDLTASHIKIARRQAEKFSNLSFEEANFNQLRFLDQSFDIVFAFECLCHASADEIPLAEIFRVLRPGGKLIVFDGYRKNKLEQLSPLLQTASQLVEVSMAVRNGFSLIDDWYAIAQSIGFRVEVREDISWAIQPTLWKLQKLSLKLFSLSWKAKILTYLLPKYLVRNSIAGLLMPFTVSPKGEAFGYYKLILERPLSTIRQQISVK
ncbi:class I SAM-dependent methyltransferase [Umezakia ovalisporum]|uniref:Class I SAM-dependent methyltransferase n=2 Tax=Umezakia ovalisporum TaxID=75695 RepID=A0AA43KFC5_9CYAN|nr:class I SAM-dependent methyltransferase [Umezakia ovalisporum]MDH6056150.1 class I SAM-dependent methyltransferase [Umezakia ovalisporum FSS-43]MDH6064005.1 class I SAM-dependent methyltransferase [Umezakia ovalisporum FSS-62]MDH6066569.1 class I SAM-dependent methyltransferase [Umezakia ovalisporum APH033B]MDH6070683.1 class I SAM-dependent methyltransferase [Umezakia ovalisporum CobakiLakeA]MDH6073952.1 class I SAM-dependent methyltransferase [Umezakia ovalisporum CS-1034]